ncbi:MAG: MlaD family protein [Candidatus Omnitrophota bacterium]
MKNIEFEVRIGLFVFVGLILLTIITFSIGDFFFKPGYNLNVELDFANGVSESAPVRLAGIEVGEVKDAAVFKDKDGRTRVKLILWLAKEAAVEKDAKIYINTLGLIGEKYVEIVPGTPGSELVIGGETLKGSSTVSVERITRKGYEVALKMEEVVDSFSEMLNQVKSGEGTLGKLVFDDSLYNEVRDMAQDLKANPWKLLNKPKEPRQKSKDVGIKSGNRGAF